MRSRMHNNDFIGLVLCGGRSTRMGRDKGLIRPEKTTWAAHQYKKLNALGMPTFISVNEMQITSYQKIFPSDQLVHDLPFISINGPLRGLLSAHQAFPEKHILCIPCDMPDLSEKFLSELTDAFFRNYPVYQVFIPLVNWQMQPLCGIYAKESLSYFTEQYEADALAHESMIHIVEEYPGTMVMLFEDADVSEFENYNTPEDLK